MNLSITSCVVLCCVDFGIVGEMAQSSGGRNRR